MIGEETLTLVRPVVEVGERRMLELKGKSEPVAGYPLLAVAEALERRFATPIVGRENAGAGVDASSPDSVMRRQVSRPLDPGSHDRPHGPCGDRK